MFSVDSEDIEEMQLPEIPEVIHARTYRKLF